MSDFRLYAIAAVSISLATILPNGQEHGELEVKV